MAEIRITFKPSMGVLAKKFGSVRVDKFLSEKVKELTYIIWGESRRITPVRTGLLRASIRPDYIRSLKAEIGPHTHYAIYVHEGTRYMRARPFMYKGAKASIPRFEARLRSDLERFIQVKIK